MFIITVRFIIISLLSLSDDKENCTYNDEIYILLQQCLHHVRGRFALSQCRRPLGTVLHHEVNNPSIYSVKQRHNNIIITFVITSSYVLRSGA